MELVGIGSCRLADGVLRKEMSWVLRSPCFVALRFFFRVGGLSLSLAFFTFSENYNTCVLNYIIHVLYIFKPIIHNKKNKETNRAQ